MNLEALLNGRPGMVSIRGRNGQNLVYMARLDVDRGDIFLRKRESARTVRLTLFKAVCAQIFCDGTFLKEWFQKVGMQFA